MFTEKFNSYVCQDDYVSCEIDNIEFRAVVKYDDFANVDDYYHYNNDDRQRWYDDKWYFCGIMVEAYVNDTCINSHCASLWGIEANFSDNNSYLDEVANELLHEAIPEAKKSLKEMFDKVF